MSDNMTMMVCENPECDCENCTCDPCTCSIKNPCGCDGREPTFWRKLLSRIALKGI